MRSDMRHERPTSRAAALHIAALLLALSGCDRNAASLDASEAKGETPAVAAHLATEPTYRRAANDSAVWRNEAEPQASLLLVTGGEGGLELHDLAGKRVARFENIETDFVELRQNAAIGVGASRDLVIASDQPSGSVRVYVLDAANRKLQDVTAQPLEVNDEITGLCTYESALTGKLYAYVATDQGMLGQWELFGRQGRIGGRLVRSVAAGKGAGHCVADDAAGDIYFSEESVGVWRIAAEPESDAARTPVDLVEPLGALQEEVKGLALYRLGAGTAYLFARDAGAGAFHAYSLHGGESKSFRIGGEIEVGDAEGLTVLAEPLGAAFPRGVIVIADEDAGDYKLASLQEVASTLGLTAKDAAEAPFPPKPAARTVQPLVETEPVASYGDAADDPAIWVDAKNPARSAVIATDKKRGLNVYDLDGKLLHTVADGRMNNVDLREGFRLDGRSIVLVAATNRTTRSISLYEFDPATRRLTSVADGVLESGLEDPYGLCMYHSSKSGEFYVLANDSIDGRLVQWRLLERGEGVGLEKVREIAVGSQAEGCAADDELGRLYVAEEDVGLWRYEAEPDAGNERTSIDDVENGNLTDDVEGVSIYNGADGAGFIVASNQGENNYAVYRRDGANDYLGKFHVVANAAAGIDGASETDGLDVVSAPLGSRFPAGLLVVQDGRNLTPSERQNFKYVSWRDVLDQLQR